MQTFTGGRIRSPFAAAAAFALLEIALPGSASALKIRHPLVAGSGDANAAGKAAFTVKTRNGSLQGQLVVSARRLDGNGVFQVTVDGVALGTLESNVRGKGRARFRTTPRAGKDQLLGVDPRGRALAVIRGDGVQVLSGNIPGAPLGGGEIRCCLPDDSGTECEDRTPAECAAEGGVDLGPGSCLPNPCAETTPAPDVPDVACCLLE